MVRKHGGDIVAAFIRGYDLSRWLSVDLAAGADMCFSGWMKAVFAGRCVRFEYEVWRYQKLDPWFGAVSIHGQTPIS